MLRYRGIPAKNPNAWHYLCDQCGDELDERIIKQAEGYITKSPTDSSRNYIASLLQNALSEDELRVRREDNQKGPLWSATFASLFTLTRYSDIALRPIIGMRQSPQHEMKFGFARLQRQAVLQLAVIGIVCHISVALLCGCFQPGPWSAFIFALFRKPETVSATLGLAANIQTEVDRRDMTNPESDSPNTPV